ncbi:glycosyltransferase family 25 protein [Pseudoalteromonas piscicida]
MTNLSSIPVLILSLEESAGRRVKISSQLEKAGIEFSFFDAINGGKLSAKEYFSQGVVGRKRALTPSELGCTLGHLGIYKKLTESDAGFALVLEDDVDLIEEKWNAYKDHSLDKDCLYILGGQEGMRRGRLLKAVRKQNYAEYPSFMSALFHRTCSYIVSKEIAFKILELSKSELFLADDWPFIAKNCGIKKVVYIPIFSHPIDVSDSYIEKERNQLR